MKYFTLTCLFSLFYFLHLQGQTIQAPKLIYADPEHHGFRNIHSADFDGDGLEDLVISSSYINAFWLKNLGSNLFGPVNILYNEQFVGKSVKAGDIDNDGDPDVVLACGYRDIILKLENIGNGKFNYASTIYEGNDIIIDIVLEDINADGLLDILVSTFRGSSDGGQIFWLENIDGINFKKNIISDDITLSRRLQYADLNGDGKKDIISASTFDFKFVWFENLGQGNYSSEIVIRDQLDSLLNYRIFAVDLDDDGDIDIVNSSRSILVSEIGTPRNKLFWYQNDGTGNFTQKLISVSWNVVESIAASDFDYDGDIDIFYGLDENAYLIDNLGDDTFSAPQIIANDIGVITDIYFLDIDCDLDLDILTCNTDLMNHKTLLFENDAYVSANINTSLENQISVFPNPSSGIFKVNLGADLVNNDIVIFDFQGKKHFEARIETESLLIAVPFELNGPYIFAVRDRQNNFLAKSTIMISN